MSRASASSSPAVRLRPLHRLHRIAAACALLLVAALIGPGSPAAAAPSPGEMAYACALKSNGLLRAVGSLAECKSNETKVTVKPGPVLVCVQPSGSTRLTKNARDCKPPALVVTLPPLAGTVYFCAALPSGTLRYVSGPGQCLSGEVQVQVTPNDAAPSVTTTAPAANATHVGTSVTPAFTFSEPVTATVGSFALACDTASIPFTISGSGTTTVTLHPTGSLPQGAACSATAYAAGISDVDTLDPPDNPVADRSFSFTTDTAPSLVSSTPAADATGVATTTNIALTFSEPVDVATGAFALSCGGGSLPYAVTGSGTSTVTVNPDADLPQTATCTLTAAAADITDVDAGDPPDALASPINLSFVTVDDAPTLVSLSPADGATNVATDANIVMTFSEPVSVPSAASFALECPSGGPSQGFTLLSLTGTTLTLDPTLPLPEGETCRLTAAASAITDVDAVDPPDTLTADIDMSFTVDAPPAVTTTSPADGATGVPVTSALTVTFSEPVTVAASSFGLTCDSTPVAFAVSGSGTAMSTITPNSDLPGTASCTLTVVASNVHDVDAGDPPDTMVANVTATFTTVDAAPTVVSTSPLDGATGVASGASVTVTFSEPVTADADALALECPTGAPTATTTTGSGTATLTLTPDAPLPADTLCWLTVTGSKIHDVDAVDPPDEMAADFYTSFTVAANSAPTDLSLAPSTVAENEPSGTAVGTFTSTDPDPGDSFTYALAPGAGDTDNGSFAIVGDELRTAASFDAETKASYAIRVSTTDSAGNVLAKTFTITVTDVNEAPTDITLTNSSVPENQPLGTAVGTLGAADPDAGQTHTFSVVTSASTGCGGTYADGSAFGVSGGALVTAASLDFEGKSSYSVCLRTTDDGSPALSFDELFTIVVTNVDEAPVVGADSYSGAIGNTLAVRGVTATGPATSLTGDLPLTNDSDPEGQTVSVVAGTVATTGGGSASINADGTFSYLPGVGDVSQTDAFTYTVTDGSLTATGTISITIRADRVWWVSATGAPSGGGDGRSTSPFETLTPLNGAGGSGDVDGTGDYVFVYDAHTSYAGGLALETDQRLYGQGFGLAVGGTTLVAPAGGVTPSITNAAGDGLTLANGVTVQGVDIFDASGDGIHGDAVTSATIGVTVFVDSSGADGIDLTGAATGNITIGATIRNSLARSVNVSNRTGGTTTFSRPISGPEVILSGNSGATVAFTGALTISSGADSAFSATGGGTVTASDTTSTLTSTTGSTLVVENTTIGTTGLKFKSVSANGAANGIRLNNTGSSGGLTVLGGGSTSLGGNASGGTIQNTTGPGVSLTSTSAVSLNNLTVSGTPNAAGVLGTQVTGFSFTNGTVTNSGQTSKGAADSSIAFTSAGSTNVTGAVTVTNSVLSNAYQHGIHVQNQSGTISSLHLDSNAITSTTSTTTSAGNGIFLQVNGSAGAAASVTSGTVSGNAITGFPSGSGFVALVGNESVAGVPSVTFGTGAGASAVAISGNRVAGASTAVPMGGKCIQVFLTGRATGFADVTNNGTGANPLGLNKGSCIDVAADGAAQLTSQITGNTVKPQAQLGGTYGITGGSDKHDYGAAGSLDSAVLQANVSNNTVSSTTGVGIYLVANSAGTSNLKVQNNVVAAPTDLVARPGIRVDSGTSVGSAVNTTVCLTISGNTATGATDGANTYPGIGLRKQGTLSTTNTFGITGLAPSPATGLQMESYVAGQNPASASGNFGTGGAANVAGSNYVSCTMPVF